MPNAPSDTYVVLRLSASGKELEACYEGHDFIAARRHANGIPGYSVVIRLSDGKPLSIAHDCKERAAMVKHYVAERRRTTGLPPPAPSVPPPPASPRARGRGRRKPGPRPRW